MLRKLVAVGAAIVAVAAGSSSAAGQPSAIVRAATAPVVAPSCGDGYYKNVDGICVPRPSSNPNGATARCRDGSYSYSRHASGTCSGHGGVARWIHHP